jgi:hypothetical protein
MILLFLLKLLSLRSIELSAFIVGFMCTSFEFIVKIPFLVPQLVINEDQPITEVYETPLKNPIYKILLVDDNEMDWVIIKN